MNSCTAIDKIESGDISKVVFAEDCFDWPLARQLETARGLCAASFDFHRQRSPRYAQYVERTAAFFATSPANVETFPPIPAAAFKRGQTISVDAGEIERWSLSSGTSGIQSLIGRSRTTVERLLGSIRAGLTLLPEWSEEEIEVIHLGPSYEHAGDIWFPFMMSLTELLYPTTSHAVNGIMDDDAAARQLHRVLAQGKSVGVIGAPFAVAKFANHVSQHHPVAVPQDKVFVITGGGWKRASGEFMQADGFRRDVAGKLNIASLSNIRDGFNQVELNTVFLECSVHCKHVPPWVWPMTRDPATLQPLPQGQEGLLSYVDASAESYPCIIVSDDVGVVRRGACACGRDAVTVEFIRRVERGGRRGCAISLEGA